MTNERTSVGGGGREDARLWGRAVERHALGWMVAANVVGVLLAAELMWPELGDALAPLTYGRWMPLHMNWQLYGWCAVPLVGVLLAWSIDERHPRASAHVGVALGAWSLVLALGGVAWLGGVTSGKLFLDWAGWTRAALPVAMVVLWTVCAAHAWWRRGAEGRRGEDRVRGGFLAVLVWVPGLLYWAAGREVYPSVNPHSGGATGASLLGSTLGLVVIFGLVPVMLRVGTKEKSNLLGYSLDWREWGFWVAWVGAVAVFLAMDRGDASHHARGQAAGLAVVLAWVPLAWVYFGAFKWEPAARRWLAAALGWWAVLAASGWWTFLPGVSERLKFTNGLVAHAHLAMAGLVTSMNFAILRQMCPRTEPRVNFVLWQGACTVQVAALLALGWWERDRAGDLFRAEAWTQVFYGTRLAAGAVMLVASVRWWGKAVAA